MEEEPRQLCGQKGRGSYTKPRSHPRSRSSKPLPPLPVDISPNLPTCPELPPPVPPKSPRHSPLGIPQDEIRQRSSCRVRATRADSLSPAHRILPKHTKPDSTHEPAETLSSRVDNPSSGELQPISGSLGSSRWGKRRGHRHKPLTMSRGHVFSGDGIPWASLWKRGGDGIQSERSSAKGKSISASTKPSLDELRYPPDKPTKRPKKLESKRPSPIGIPTQSSSGYIICNPDLPESREPISGPNGGDTEAPPPAYTPIPPLALPLLDTTSQPPNVRGGEMPSPDCMAVDEGNMSPLDLEFSPVRMPVPEPYIAEESQSAGEDAASHWLKPIPQTSLGDLYNVLGDINQDKTRFYGMKPTLNATRRVNGSS